MTDARKANLHTYLQHEREAVLAKLEGLSDYDVRRPLTATGTNLLGRGAAVQLIVPRGPRMTVSGGDTPYVTLDTPRLTRCRRSSGPWLDVSGHRVEDPPRQHQHDTRSPSVRARWMVRIEHDHRRIVARRSPANP